VSMFHIIGFVKGIVDASDKDQSPGENRQHLICDQSVAVVRFASSEGVDCCSLVHHHITVDMVYSQLAILLASIDGLQKY
jgi:hypothetical protein